MLADATRVLSRLLLSSHLSSGKCGHLKNKPPCCNLNVFIDKFVFLIGKTRDKRDFIYMHVRAHTHVCVCVYRDFPAVSDTGARKQLERRIG